jgi:hypothetical protein
VREAIAVALASPPFCSHTYSRTHPLHRGGGRHPPQVIVLHSPCDERGDTRKTERSSVFSAQLHLYLPAVQSARFGVVVKFETAKAHSLTFPQRGLNAPIRQPNRSILCTHVAAFAQVSKWHTAPFINEPQRTPTGSVVGSRAEASGGAAGVMVRRCVTLRCCRFHPPFAMWQDRCGVR